MMVVCLTALKQSPYRAAAFTFRDTGKLPAAVEMWTAKRLPGKKETKIFDLWILGRQCR